MNNEIKPTDTGVSVYGVKQMEYTLDGDTGRKLDFGAVVSDAAIKQAVTTETNAQVVASAVKMRSRKIEDLGKILSLVSEALAKFSTKNPESSDKIPVSINDKDGKNLEKLKADVKRYGVDLGTGFGEKDVKDGCHTKTVEDRSVITLRRDVAMRAQSNVQQMIDKEDNDLQQDKVTLQGFITKTDKSFSMAGDLVNKLTQSSGKVIANMED